MFCRYCGTELSNDARFCSKCGKPTPEQAYTGEYSYTPPVNSPINARDLVTKFSERVKTNAIIWIVIGALQILLGIYVQWVLLIVGVLNLITAIVDLNYSKSVLQNPVGIVNRVKSLVGPILILIYNLIFGGVIGVAGSIYYLVAVRGFVMENEPHFQAIEHSVQ